MQAHLPVRDPEAPALSRMHWRAPRAEVRVLPAHGSLGRRAGRESRRAVATGAVEFAHRAARHALGTRHHCLAAAARS
eukprot:3573001-Rhodomonas_salina.2